MKPITEKTLIPLGVAILVIGGGAAWLTRLHFIADATATEMKETKSYTERIRDALESIDKRLSRIEAFIEKRK